MWKGRGPNIQFLLQGYCVYILCCLFIYYLKFIKILDFDDLIFKCCFFMLIKLLNVVDRVWNDIVWWNGVELNSYIWDNVWTDVCCILSIDAYVVTEISELHWWSKSHRLRYQVVRSWWGSSCRPWHMRCKTWVVLNLPWSFLLDLLVIFGSGVSLW